MGLLDCGYCMICVCQFYELDRDFLEIVIFNLGSGNIYLGVLVLANVDFLFGIFCLLGLECNLVMLIIDLFGIGEEGFFIVVEFFNVMVSLAIDEVLEYWNNMVFQQGYFNGVCFYYEVSEVFEQWQLGIELGINVEWVIGLVVFYFSISMSIDWWVVFLAFW